MTQTGASTGRKNHQPKMIRKNARMPEDLGARIEYWAEHHGISFNQYLIEAAEMKIRYENGDYPLPTLEQLRLAELTDRYVALEKILINLQRTVESGFSSLLGLTRGDNYLTDELEHEDGELYDA